MSTKMPTPTSVSIKTEKGVEIPQSRKDMDLDQVKTYIDATMEVYHGLEDMSDLKGMYEMGKSLSRAYFNCQAFRKEAADMLTNHEFPVYASKMMKRLNNMGVFKNDDIWFSSFYFYNITWNFSDASSQMAAALAQAGLPNLLSLNIGHQPYLDNLTSKNVYYLIKASLSIIQNICRVPGNSHWFADEAVKESLVFLAQREEEFLKCVATLSLAYIVTENEVDKNELDKSVNAVEKLIEFVDKANKSEKRRYHGFTAEEILAALSVLCVNDNVKQAIVKSQGVPLFKTLCESSNSSEVNYAIKCMWNLAFDKDVRQQLVSEYQIIPFLQKIQTTHESSEVKTTCDGALWLITQESTKVEQALHEEKKRIASAGGKRELSAPPPCASGLKNYFFLSYCHGNKENVYKVHQRLKELGVPVWIDTEHMGSNLLDGMADGIEHSLGTLVCMSDQYKQSSACRMEAEYSYQLRKPIIPLIMQYKYKPSGWLGLLLGSKKHFEFSGRRDFENVMDQLYHEIEEIRRPIIHKQTDTVDSRMPAKGGDNHVSSSSIDDPKTVTSNHIPQSSVNNNNNSAGSAKNSVDYNMPDHGGYSHHDDVMHSSTVDYPPSYNTPLSSKMPPHLPVAARVSSKVLRWTCEEVRSWLEANELSSRCAVMAEINGKLLAQMAQMRAEAPEFFFRCLQDRLGFSLIELLRFSEALSKLTLVSD